MIIRSIVSDLNWVCDDSWIPAFSQVDWRKSNIWRPLLSSVHLLYWSRSRDALLWLAQVREGTWKEIKIHPHSDHYGRIPAILSSNLVALVSGIAIPFVTEYVTFCVLRWHFISLGPFFTLLPVSSFVMGFSYSSFFNFPYDSFSV